MLLFFPWYYTVFSVYLMRKLRPRVTNSQEVIPELGLNSSVCAFHSAEILLQNHILVLLRSRVNSFSFCFDASFLLNLQPHGASLLSSIACLSLIEVNTKKKVSTESYIWILFLYVSASSSWNSYQSLAVTHEKDPESRTGQTNFMQHLVEPTERQVCQGLAMLIMVVMAIKMVSHL